MPLNQEELDQLNTNSRELNPIIDQNRPLFQICNEKLTQQPVQQPQPILHQNGMQQTQAASTQAATVANSNTNYEQVLDYLKKNKAELITEFGIKDFRQINANKTIELTMENSPLKGYVEKNATGGIQYKVATSDNGNDMIQSIENICKLAVANANEDTVFDISVAPAELRDQVEEALEAAIKDAVAANKLDPAKLPKIKVAAPQIAPDPVQPASAPVQPARKLTMN